MDKTEEFEKLVKLVVNTEIQHFYPIYIGNLMIKLNTPPYFVFHRKKFILLDELKKTLMNPMTDFYTKPGGIKKLGKYLYRAYSEHPFKALIFKSFYNCSTLIEARIHKNYDNFEELQIDWMEGNLYLK